MYAARIRQDATGSFYALVIRTDRDGSEQVDPSFKGRYFATHAAAERATARHIAKVVA